MKTPPYFHRLWILYSKEWFRLKRNPAAFMAAGLIVLMAFLVSIENKASQISRKQEALPCYVVYLSDSSLIHHLKKSMQKNVRFLKMDGQFFNENIQYPENIRCLAEISEFDRFEKHQIQVTNKAVDGDSLQMVAFNRWLLTAIANFNPNIQFTQQLKRIKGANTATKTLGKIDLSSQQGKSMIGSMMIFSAQFFVCCGLMISFTAYERERGILQAMSMTTTKPGEMLFAKLLFHVTLSLVTSLIIYKLISGVLWQNIIFLSPVLLLVFTFSSIGFVGVATIIVSLNRHQSTASLVGFCYLMLMGVVFSLASKFQAFLLIKQMMFESHAISLFSILLGNFSLSGYRSFLTNTLDLLLFSSILWLIAYFCFKYKGWKT